MSSTLKHTKKAIIGAGGFAREVGVQAFFDRNYVYDYFVEDEYFEKDVFEIENSYFKKCKIHKLSMFDPEVYLAIVAIGDPTQRKRVVESMPENTAYWSFLSSDNLSFGNYVGVGSIVCAGAIITTNVKIGKHTHININSTIGHDCVIGDYNTISPNVSISGNVITGDKVFIGSNASIREKVTICSDTVIGMNAAVLNNIQIPNTYVGIPAKPIL